MRWRLPSRPRCSFAGLVAAAGFDGRKPAMSRRSASPPQFAQEQPVAMRQEPCHPAQIWPGGETSRGSCDDPMSRHRSLRPSVQFFGWTCGDEW